ncbi:MAG: hypothetical protein ACERKK_07820 [Poseidonibacter sp.]|uniref:hypothetical protein n=1 Tax=Poseidonibacter sp. TaxID=2321188 RepID=UPI00359DC090
MKESNIESIDEVKIINHSNLAYKLNISVYAQKLMSNEKVVIHNPEVLTYTKNLDLINKLK